MRLYNHYLTIAGTPLPPNPFAPTNASRGVGTSSLLGVLAPDPFPPFTELVAEPVKKAPHSVEDGVTRRGADRSATRGRLYPSAGPERPREDGAEVWKQYCTRDQYVLDDDGGRTNAIEEAREIGRSTRPRALQPRALLHALGRRARTQRIQRASGTPQFRTRSREQRRGSRPLRRRRLGRHGGGRDGGDGGRGERGIVATVRAEGRGVKGGVMRRDATAVRRGVVVRRLERFRARRTGERVVARARGGFGDGEVGRVGVVDARHVVFGGWRRRAMLRGREVRVGAGLVRRVGGGLAERGAKVGEKGLGARKRGGRLERFGEDGRGHAVDERRRVRLGRRSRLRSVRRSRTRHLERVAKVVPVRERRRGSLGERTRVGVER